MRTLSSFFSAYSLRRYMGYLFTFFLLFLPWQTIWIYTEVFVEGGKWEYGTLGYYGTEIVLWGIIVVSFLFFLVSFKEKKFAPDSLWNKKRVVLLSGVWLLAYLWIRSWFADDVALAFQQTSRIIAAGFVLLFLSIHLISFQRVLWALSIGSLVPSFLGIWQFTTQQSLSSVLLGVSAHPVFQAGTSIVAEPSGRWLRAYGTFSHPNMLGGFCVLVIIALLLLLSIEKRRYYRMFAIVVFCITVVALYMSYSRSAWIALSIVVAVFFLQQELGKRVFIPLVSIPFIFFILSTMYTPLIVTRFMGGSINETQSISERVSGMHDALGVWKSAAFFGVGPGNYTLALQHYVPNKPIWYYQPVHMVPVLVLSEVGIIGGLLGIVLLYWWYHLYPFLLRWRVGMLLLPLVPLLLVDHYLFSSYSGLMLLSLWIGIAHGSVHMLSPLAKVSLE